MSAWCRLMLFHDTPAEEGMTARLGDHDEYMAMLLEEWADEDLEPAEDDPERDAALLAAIESGEIDEYLHWLNARALVRARTQEVAR